MALAKFLNDFVLFVKRACFTVLRVSEDVPRLIEDSDLIVVFELPPFVPANKRLINEGAVARQVLQNSNGLVAFVFLEY